jgi:hypothetical protein
MKPVPFTLDIPEADIDDLKARLARPRSGARRVCVPKT